MKVLRALSPFLLFPLFSCSTTQGPCPCTEQLARQKADLLALCQNGKNPSPAPSSELSQPDLNSPATNNLQNTDSGLEKAYDSGLPEVSDVGATDTAVQALPTPAENSQSDSLPTYWVRANMLNIRTGPGTHFPSAGVVLHGEELKAERDEDGWIQIAEGRYVMKSYLTTDPIKK